jgi:tetratricopeptide (TPR) repeat protein
MKSITTLFAGMISLSLLAGCTSTESIINKFGSNPIYLDDEFKTDKELIKEESLFYLSDDMKRYVRKRLMPIEDYKDRTTQLLEDLFDPEQLDINYVHNANLTAAQAFDQGVANCLSLTLLSYVLIKEAGLDAQFNDVKVQENWSQRSGISMLNGHVNLQVFEPINANEVAYFRRVLTIDFLPMLSARVKSSKKLSKNEIVSLYYNNKGADALIEGRKGLAYHYFKKATLAGPNLSAPWGNLASLYRQNGFLEQAEQLYLKGSKLDPHNLNIKENLALLYRLTDRPELAEPLLINVKQERKDNPYYHAMLAAELYEKGQYKESIKKYKLAYSMNDKEHQFLFGIAKNYLMLDNLYTANRYLKKAHILANTQKEKQDYQSKISALENMNAKRFYN